MEIELEAFESKEFSIFLGTEADITIENYKNVEYCENKLKEIQKMWFDKFSALQVKTPVESMNIMLNGWLEYQTIESRLYARSRLYAIWWSLWLQRPIARYFKFKIY